jgi:hypothetical protein
MNKEVKEILEDLASIDLHDINQDLWLMGLVRRARIALKTDKGGRK